MPTTRPASPGRCVVLLSGSGTNLQALIDASLADRLGGEIVAVISNRPDAGGLARAERHGIPAQVLDHTAFASREDYDEALQDAIDAHTPDLVVLAGFMRILTPGFVTHYTGRMLNIHPSLLPAYKGLHTHRRVLEAGDTEHGCSVHFVTAELDGGPVIAQARLTVKAGDSEDSLADQVHRLEHRLYPHCVALFLTGRLGLSPEGQPTLDGAAYPQGALDL